MVVVSSQSHQASHRKAVPGHWEYKRDMQAYAQLPASDASQRKYTPM
jgi:hypothetical protein